MSPVSKSGKSTKTRSQLGAEGSTGTATTSKSATASGLQLNGSRPITAISIRRESEERWMVQWFKEGVMTAAHRCTADEVISRVALSLTQMEPLP